MRKRFLTLTLCLPIVAACGGGSTGSSGSSAPTGPSAPTGASGLTLAQPVTTGQTLAQFAESGVSAALGNTSVSYVRDVNNDTSGSVSTEILNAEIVYDDDTDSFQVVLSTLDHTVTLTEADLSGDQTEFEVTLPDGDTTVYFWTYNGTWLDVVNGTSQYQYVVQYGASDFSDSSGINNRTFGVLGIQTADGAMPNAGSAVYTGGLAGNIASVNSADRETMLGDVAMNVDFDASTLDGSVTNIRIGHNTTTSQLLINPTTISGTTFSTTLSDDPATCGTGCSTFTSSSVDGSFFGPNAEEIGATFSIEGVDDGEGFLAVGSIAAAR